MYVCMYLYAHRAHKSSPFCFGCLQFDECGLKIRDGNSPSMRRKRNNEKKEREKRKQRVAQHKRKKDQEKKIR